MNTHWTINRMPTFDMQTSDLVPVAGELIMDATSNNVKIGDGKSPLKDLPWVNYGNKGESNLSHTARMFIENSIELIENNDYDTLYSRIATPGLAQEVTRALLKADLNPRPYLSKVPNSIKHILDPDSVWIDYTAGLYTRSEINATLNEWNKKLLMEIDFPENMIKVGN